MVMRSAPALSRLAAAVLAILAALPALADDLSAERRSVRVDERVAITVSLEGPFAVNETLSLPVNNLAVEGPPSVSSEFSWINGTVTRRKVFRFTVHPLRPGLAVAGPLVVNGEGGQRETLAAITLQVVADTANVSNDPQKILHDLLATGREPLFLVTEVDKNTAAVGEEVVVTWVLYNAAAVEQWQIGSAPKLDAFWSEEIEVRNEQPEHVIVDGIEMERVAVRRVALFPLRSGNARIGGMGVKAEIMRRIEGGPISLFEGTMVESGFESAPVTIAVRGLPPGPPPDAIGAVTLACTPPVQSGGGPVAFSATLSGRANLRGVAPPRVDRPIDGELQVQPMPLRLQRGRDGVTMTRQWQYLVFPAHAGSLVLPPVSISVYNPGTAAREVLRCGGATLQVAEAFPPATGPPSAPFALRLQWRDLLPWGCAVAAIALAAFLVAPRLRASLRLRRQVRALIGGRTPVQIREALTAHLQQLGVDVNAVANEASDRGDAYRSLVSLVEALERDRFTAAETRDELRLRVREVLEAFADWRAASDD